MMQRLFFTVFLVVVVLVTIRLYKQKEAKTAAQENAEKILLDNKFSPAAQAIGNSLATEANGSPASEESASQTTENSSATDLRDTSFSTGFDEQPSQVTSWTD